MTFSLNKLSHKIFLASLLCILPSIFISLSNVWSTYHTQIENLQYETDFFAQQMMHSQSLRVNRAERYLKLLSKSAEIQLGSEETCNEFVRQQLVLSEIFSNIGSPLASGDLKCNATALTKAVNVIERPYIKNALEHAEFSISRLIEDKVSKTLSINLAQPVYDPLTWEVSRLVVGVLSFEWWQVLLERANHENLLAFITDKDYNVIASHGEFAPQVGEHFLASGNFSNQDFILVKKEYIRDNANHKLALSFWAALPTKKAYNLARNELIKSLIIIMLGLLVSALILTLSAKYLFIRPVSHLLNEYSGQEPVSYNAVLGLENIENSIKKIAFEQQETKQNLSYTEQELIQAYHKQDTILKSVSVGIVELDHNLQILSFSKRCQTFYQVTHEEVKRQLLMALNLITENQQDNDIKCIYDAFHATQDDAFEVISQSVRTQDSESEKQILYFKWSFSKVDFSTSETKWVALVEDVTEQQIQNETLAERASKDWLTKLPNRYAIMKMIDASITKNEKNGFSLVLLDLNGFKLINDSFGHDIGDALIIALSKRMQSLLLDDEYIGRLGGDEFLLYLPRRNALNRIRFLHQCFFEAIEIQKRTFNCSASAGVAVYPEHGEDALSLIRCADLAMYASKKSQLNDSVYYDEDLEKKGIRRFEIESAITDALDHDEFSLHYQPVINPLKNTVTCIEALIRCNSAKLGFISPAEFIPIAEESGLIHQIGHWVLDRVLSDLSLLRLRFGEQVKVHMNLSPYQLKDQGLIDKLLHLSSHSEKADSLVLEITESALVDEGSVKILSQLKDAGYIIALDDFGTGFSSLSHIAKMPIQILKIDQSFIDQSGHSQRDMTLLKNIILMAKGLDLTIIAEGVEEIEQASLLIQFGCHNMQGYLYSKPIPLSGLNESLSDMPTLKYPDITEDR